MQGAVSNYGQLPYFAVNDDAFLVEDEKRVYVLSDGKWVVIG